MSELSEWDSFYVIVGSAAGALVGLQFVVMTLIAEKPPVRAPEVGAAFATPTVMHFSSVLLLSAVVRAPWKAIAPLAVFWGALGLAGCVYSAVVAWRVRRQTYYRPVLEDWAFHVLLPLVAYVALALCALKRWSMSAQRCSASARRCCCCSSSAYTTHGTPSPTTSSCR